MGDDIPRTSESRHPILRQLFTPFYRTRMRRVQRNSAKIEENMTQARMQMSNRRYAKELRRKGILK